MHELASTILEQNLEEYLVDVPAVLAHGRINYPLGRYLRRKLRTFIGRSPDVPRAALEAHQAELQAVRQIAFNHSIPFKTAVLQSSEGKRIQIETHYRRKNRRSL